MSRIYVKTIYALCGKYINSSLTWVLMRFCNATFHNKVVQQVSVTLLWAFETHRQAKKNSHSLIKRCPQFVCLFLVFLGYLQKRSLTVDPPCFQVSSAVLSPSDENEGDTCTICFEAWTTAGEHRLAALRCGHLFGYTCIQRWLKAQSPSAKCPQVRRKKNPIDHRWKIEG